MRYSVRIGSRRAKAPARDLYRIPVRVAEDDGQLIIWAGDYSPLCPDCGRGHLQWAEAGYVSWWRICDCCGSHWDLHPLPGIALRQVPMDEPADVPPSRRPTREVLSVWQDGRGFVALDPAAPITSREYQNDEPIGHTWGELLAAITSKMRAAAEVGRDCQIERIPTIPCCWARRGRLYL